MISNVRLLFLGTGAGAPGRDRYLSSVLLDDGYRRILLDTGEGVQYRLAEVGVSVLKITHILITHLHGDHVFGLPGLLASMAMFGRKIGLTIVGPRGLSKIVDATVDIVGKLPYPLDMVELGDDWGSLKLSDDLTVKYALARHTVPNYAYSLEWKVLAGRFNPQKARELGVPVRFWRRLHMGQQVVLSDGRIISPDDVLSERSEGYLRVTYTGDTAPCDSLVKLSAGSHVLIHESTFSSREDGEGVWKQGHSRARDAAEDAREARARLLVLTHISNRYSRPEELAREAAEIFPRVIAARDFLAININSITKKLSEDPVNH